MWEQRSLKNTNVTGYCHDGGQEFTPTSLSDLEDILKWSRANATPIYPFSTGYNWGLGSRVPVDKRCILVNLGQLNDIYEFDNDDCLK